MSLITQEKLKKAYEDACEVELQAFKPGNVSVYSDGHDMTVEDFRISAEVSSGPITNPDYSLGEKIYYAVKATREAVGCNTNLGIILLCAPMLQAMAIKKEHQSFRQILASVLENTTIEDAEWAFKGIALASPGGLGDSEDQDVSEKPDVTLTQAMAIAGDKDRIALQYVTKYKDVFDFANLRYNDGVDRWGNANWAVVAVFAGLLRQFPDSHIERKYGKKYTGMVTAKMALLDDELSKTQKPELLEKMLYSIDQEFKSTGINPGTTADMTVAVILSVYLNQLTS